MSTVAGDETAYNPLKSREVDRTTWIFGFVGEEQWRGARVSGETVRKIGRNPFSRLCCSCSAFNLKFEKRQFGEGAVCGFLLLIPVHQNVEPSVDTLA